MSPSPDTSPQDHGKLRILVVDDEPTLRLGFAYALSNKITLVETANNGRQALERLAEKSFDVMILDLRMPEIDGITVIDTLRSQGDATRVILCSAAMNPEVVLRAIRHGVVDFLLKPVRPVDLRQVVEFVTQPDRDPFSRAADAMRRRCFDEASAILENEGDSQPRTACWLKLLRAILADEENSSLQSLLQHILPVIAFNPTFRP